MLQRLAPVSSCAGYIAKRRQRLPEETVALIVVAVVVVSLAVSTLLVEIEIESRLLVRRLVNT
jgi:hypothetical protein